jgi:hypothetical protein
MTRQPTHHGYAVNVKDNDLAEAVERAAAEPAERAHWEREMSTQKMTTWTDTPQQKAVLRQSRTAHKVRADFPQHTRVEGFTGERGTGAFGTVYRHVPHTNAQGGVLVIDWDSGVRGRSSPIAVRRVDR